MNYTEPKYCRLEPYHNPDEVDESKVPSGWRMRYQREIKSIAQGQCRSWRKYGNCFSNYNLYGGTYSIITHIVPVKED